MEFFSSLHQAQTSDEIAVKERIVKELLAYCNTGEYAALGTDFVPEVFVEPSYARRCRIVPPRELPRRRRLRTAEDLALQVHAILHIEYSAIDLALDAVYRFPEMPLAYRRDWLEVAEDELRHFRMLEKILEELGFRYGDFPVHQGLFDAGVHTAGDVLERMAVVPRHYEATGLDVNPRIVERLRSRGDLPGAEELLAALETIYREEIDHVRKGDHWFRRVCAERGLDAEETFFEILERYRLRQGRGEVLNVEARREAGFACSELLRLGAVECGE
ncbi:ferritin-like domain-containing protein [Nitratifractor sp.]